MAEPPSPAGHEAPDKVPDRRGFFWPGGLSARLLILTILFVLLGGAIIVPPTLAAFEEQWLLDRIRAAELASLATEVAPDRVVSEQLSSEILEAAGVEWVAIQSDGVRRLVLRGQRMSRTPYLVDLRDQAPASWLAAPFQTLFGGEDRMVRVVAEPRFRDAEFIEIVAPDAELKQELTAYLWRLVAVTAFVSAVAGGLVYLSLNLFLVRPMQRITRGMELFRADPDDPRATVKLSGRRDEVGRAEVELARMQADVRAALNSRARLAALGEAVAKINHDLRNMLTSAQIASERLAASEDPDVGRALPRLERALDRAVKLASHVLAYGRSQEPAPEARPALLAEAVEMAAEEARLSESGVRLDSDLDPADRVLADPDQLHRILVNLMRNAREAIEQQPERQGRGAVRVALIREGDLSLVRLSDNGPGVPDKVRERLFLPFAGSGRPGGTGLGLAIARELAQGHGGDLVLASSGPQGSTFELRLPGAPARVQAKGRGGPKPRPRPRRKAPTEAD
ncbi:sensor histidine kinase [Phenylobacterium sp.]|uniref:sensor histidine kinase n=1 Tax=Phenylobacterium sp. TaxID=1871053 RepID=UPI0018530C84|nr:HAMP domain-containing sensor histidine kinase [Phenylobacterium sp.]MBA4794319.1 HAMP domain-containing histidine kinase [Phenylobacterium sp.]